MRRCYVTDGGKRMLDLDDHWEWHPDHEAVFPRCDKCGRRYRRGAAHACEVAK